MNLTFTSQLTPADIEEWLAHNGKAVASCPALKPRGRPTSRFNRSLFGWLLILILAVTLFTVFHHDAAPAAAPVPPPEEGRKDLWAIVSYILPYVIVGVLVWVFFLRAVSKKGRAKAIWEKFHDFHQPRTIQASDDGLIITMPTVENRISWPHFVHFYETPGLFLLYNSSQAAHLFPKRDFPDAAAAESFRQLCETHISRMPTAFPVVLAGGATSPQAVPPAP
jgi:hypothetical protein